MNKKALFLLTNLPVWAILFSFVYSISFYRYFNGVISGGLPHVISYAITLLIWLFVSFYVFYSNLVPTYLLKGRNLLFWSYALLYCLLIGPLLIITLDMLNKGLVEQYSPKIYIEIILEDPTMIIGSLLMLSIITITCAFLGILSRLAFESFNNLQLKKDLENKNLLNEINVIKSKLNPHLLFNTLNNIDTLIHSNPDKASNSLSKLSNILRYVVYDSDKEMISIQEEIDSLNNYIDLEKIRLKNPGVVSFSPQIQKNVSVPPMLFFPFVENAFKHSNLNDPNQNLQIQLSADHEKINFNCVNTIYEKKQKADHSGVGLELTRKRLELLYSNRHNIEINQTKNKFTVILEINLKQ